MINKSFLILISFITTLLSQGCSVSPASNQKNEQYLCEVSRPTKVSDTNSAELMSSLYDTEGDKHFFKKHYKKASTCYILGLNIRTQTLGLKDKSLAKSLYNIATLHEAKEEYDEAQKSYRKVLNILRSQQKTEKFNEFLGYLAAIRYQKTATNTEKQLKNTLLAFKQLHNPRNIRTGVAHHHLANIYLEQKDVLKAIVSFKLSLSIIQQYTGRNHPYYALLLYDYSNALSLSNKKELSIKLKNQATLTFNHYPKKLHSKLYKKAINE